MSDKIEKLFHQGLRSFNNKRFYAAHEYWEEIWTDYQIPDKKFIQGLIQLSVACFHLTNDNLNGAKGLFRKSTEKFELLESSIRSIDIHKISTMAGLSLEEVNKINNASEFDWKIIKEIIIE